MLMTPSVWDRLPNFAVFYGSYALLPYYQHPLFFEPNTPNAQSSQIQIFLVYTVEIEGYSLPLLGLTSLIQYFTPLYLSILAPYPYRVNVIF